MNLGLLHGVAGIQYLGHLLVSTKRDYLKAALDEAYQAQIICLKWNFGVRSGGCHCTVLLAHKLFFFFKLTSEPNSVLSYLPQSGLLFTYIYHIFAAFRSFIFIVHLELVITAEQATKAHSDGIVEELKAGTLC